MGLVYNIMLKFLRFEDDDGEASGSAKVPPALLPPLIAPWDGDFCPSTAVRGVWYSACLWRRCLLLRARPATVL